MASGAATPSSGSSAPGSGTSSDASSLSNGELSDASDSADISDAPMAFALTSPAFVSVQPDGGGGDGQPTIPSIDTCAAAAGGNGLSPELDWTAGPTGTISYAIVLTDLTNGLHHWAVWDIPTTTLSLPEGLAHGSPLMMPEGALQQNVQGMTEFYGPCPNGSLHIYQFEIFAIPEATLAGVSGSSTTTQVFSAAAKAATTTATLTGLSNAKPN
jgi:Raf kinase inhibitor-like YbhB/YbcL family protein